ncbi:MAG TPA: NADH-quinone oxidoreductase subunit C [Terriglobales bacterium]|nr:NADH-quinone oxidoreductase subunit C [Terriglobales bacterium]
MPLEAAITDVEKVKDHPAVARLLAWKPEAVQGVKWDREEMSVCVERSLIREAAALLKDDPALRFDFLSDLTCVDWYPNEPRFEVVYHLLSMQQKERVRLKVRLAGDDASVESLTSVWPGANFFEREIWDLFGVRFLGHPNLARIMMPEDWEGHPLRKDYPVEGYR